MATDPSPLAAIEAAPVRVVSDGTNFDTPSSAYSPPSGAQGIWGAITAIWGRLADKTQTTQLTDGTDTAAIDSSGNQLTAQEILTTSGTLGSATSLTLNLGGVSCGTWMLTIGAGISAVTKVEITNDGGTTWSAVFMESISSGVDTAEPVISVATTGVFCGYIGAATQIRARVSTYVSGSSVYTLSASPYGELPNTVQTVGISSTQNAVSVSPTTNTSASLSISSATSNAISCNGLSAFTAHLSLTWVGQIVIEGQNNSGVYEQVDCYQVLTSGGYQYTQPFTANGQIYGSCAGLVNIRVRMAVYTSGTCFTGISAGIGSSVAHAQVGKGTYTANPLSVQLTDGTDTALVNTDGSLNVNVDPANNGTTLTNPIYVAPSAPADGAAYSYNTSNRAPSGFSRDVLVNINSSAIDTINGIDRTREYSTIVGSATITNSGGSDGTYKLHTTATTTDTITLETNVRGVSTAAAGTETGITLNLMDGTLPAHGFVLFGAWDGTDGAYFILDQTNLGVVTMKSTTQSTIVRPASFNVDPLDGTGPSGMVWNVAHAYTYAVRIYGDVYQTIEWYVTGAKTSSSNTYVTALVHRMIATTGTTIVGALNLPARVFMTNNANATSWNLKLGTRYIHTLGTHEPMTRVSSQVRTAVAMGNNTTYLPLISFRKKSGSLIHTRVFIDRITLIPTVAMIWSVFVNPTLTGASFVAPFNGAANDSSLEYDVSATAYTLTNAWCIHNDIVPATVVTQFIQDILATYPAGTIVSLGSRLVTAAAGTSVSAMLEAREEW